MRDITSPIDLVIAERRAAIISTHEGDKQRDEIAWMINRLCEVSHGCSRHAGWWDETRNFGELIALIQSETSEALEGGRKDKPDEHLPQFSNVGVELADAIVRITDLAGALNIELGTILIAKMQYNAQRQDHTRAARSAEGGKKF